MVGKLISIMVILGVLAGIGTYGVHYYRTEKAAADALALSLKRKDISITITEGKRREQIAAELEQAGITSASSFLAASTTLEGTLFPDTYRFYPNSTGTEVVQKMEADYNERVASLNPTPDQLVLASIVEREAGNDSERSTIAAVYDNRLRIGMRLQSDPTVQYAKDTIAYTANPSTQFTFWNPITASDYTSAVSPFNTYLNTGLPPAPICNPGLKSIEAVLHPATIDPGYIYFIEKNGQLLLAKTLAQHNLQAVQ